MFLVVLASRVGEANGDCRLKIAVGRDRCENQPVPILRLTNAGPTYADLAGAAGSRWSGGACWPGARDP